MFRSEPDVYIRTRRSNLYDKKMTPRNNILTYSNQLRNAVARVRPVDGRRAQNEESHRQPDRHAEA